MPLPGTAAALEYLAAHLRTVAVVSGRPLAFLEAKLRPEAPGILLAGLYGLERSRPGGAAAETAAGAYRGAVEAAVDEARAALPPGVLLEEKGLGLALHFRQAPHAEAAVAALAARLAEHHGLAERPAKLAVELVPPVAVDKGTVAAELAAGSAVACMLGDDAGDLAAFQALGRLVADGHLGAALRIAVAGAEAPAGLLEAAELVLDGPQDARGFLLELAERLGYTPAGSA